MRAWVKFLFVVGVVGFYEWGLLPLGSGRRRPPQNLLVRLEMKAIEAAINGYLAEYNRWPIRSDVTNDFTFGTSSPGHVTTLKSTNGNSLPFVGNPGNNSSQANNSELMTVLLSVDKYSTNGTPTVNADFSMNPRKLVFLNAKRVSGRSSGGIGDDLVFRDPWGNPYIITIDVNGDGKCDDPIYPGIGRIQIWSFGSDGKADSKVPPREGVNKDNILIRAE